MLTSIRKFLKAPIFEHEEETRIAFLLNTLSLLILVILFAGAVLSPILSAMVGNQLAYSQIINTLLSRASFLILLTVVTLVLIRVGYVRQASVVFVFTAWLIVAANMYRNGGVQGLTYLNFLLPIIIAGLFLGIRAAGLYAFISFVAGGIALYLSNQNRLPAYTPLNPIGSFVVGGISFALAALIIALYVRRLQDTLNLLQTVNQQLEESSKNLEKRVAERTQALTSSAEVSRRLSTILDPDQLMLEVVEQIKETYQYYHGQIYLLDENKKNLVLAGATGEAGRILIARGHHLPIEQGIVGKVARTQKGILVPDTAQDPTWLPNPLLPDTKAEIAVPIKLGDQVIGVLDMQDAKVGKILEEDMELLDAIANQVAIALQNAIQYDETQALFQVSQALATAATYQEMLAAFMIYGAAQADQGGLLIFNTNDDGVIYAVDYAAAWTRHTHQPSPIQPGTRFSPEQIPFTQYLLHNQTLIISDIYAATPGPQTTSPEIAAVLTQFGLAAMAGYPLMLGGQLLGAILFGYNHAHTFTERELQPLQAIANQLAILLRNQQLLAETQNALDQLNLVNQRLVGEGWHEFAKLSGGIKVEDIAPGIALATLETHNGHKGQLKAHQEITIPINVRGVDIGQFLLQQFDDKPFFEQDQALLQEVAYEVGAALENMRLLEETQQNALALEESRNLLDAVIENLPLLLFVKDAKEFRYVRWNKAGETMLGLTAADVLGKNAYDSFGKEEADRFTAQDWEILSGESLLEIVEETIETPTGTRILHTRKTPVFGPDGHPRYLVGLSEDITERKQAEKTLEALSAQNQLVLNSAGEGILGLDEKGNHTFVNPAAAQILGYTFEELIGNPSHAIWHHSRPDHTPYPEEESPIFQTLKSGSILHGEEYFWTKTNQGIPVEFTSTPIKEGGRTTGAVVTFRDISLRKQDEMLLNRRLGELESLNAIGQILATQTDLEEMLTEVGNTILNTFQTPGGYIALYDERAEMITVPFSACQGERIEISSRALGSDLASQVLRTRQPLLFSEHSDTRGTALIAAELQAPSWLGVPILSGSEVIGMIGIYHLQIENYFSANDLRLLVTIAANLSTSIQNSRLFAQTQNALIDLENLTRRLTRESWQDYMDATADELGFIYDLSRVAPIAPEMPINGNVALEQPLLVQGEVIGRLVIAETEQNDAESQEVLEAVSKQLSAHIENLRLLEQTQESRNQLQKNEARLQILVENTPDAFVTVDVSTGLFTDPNENAMKLFGLNREALLKVGPVEMSPAYQPDGELSAEKSKAYIEEALQTGETVIFEWTHINASGDEIPCELRLVRLPGDRPQVRASVTDISIRKQAEAETRRLAQAIQSTADMVVITDINGNIQFVNNAFEKTTGYKVEEAIGGNPRLLRSGVQGKDFYKTMWGHILSGEVWNGEVINRRKDGTLYTAQLSISPILNEREEIVQFVAVQRDITERKQAEEALRINEARLAEALQIAHLGHWEYDVEKDLFTFNDQFYSIFHTTAEKVGSNQLSSAQYSELFVYPEDMPIVGAEIGKALTSTEPVYHADLEHRILYADGGLGYISVQVTVERDEHGKITRFYGANQDITERKQAENILRESEARLAEALQIARLGHWEYDVEKDLFTFNNQFYSIFHSSTEKVGSNQLSSAQYAQLFVYPDDMPMVGEEIGKALNATDPIYHSELEHRIMYADGGVGYISVQVTVERDEDGKIMRFYGANQDITERKQAEQALAESTHQIELILGTAGEGILGLDENGKHVFVNPAAAQMLGYEAHELIGKISHNLWHHSRPDGTSYPSNECPIFLTLSDGITQRGEEYFWRKDGTGFPVSFTSQPIIERGKITGTVITFQNITLQKQTQEILTRRASELQTVATLSTTASTVLNPSELLQSVVNLTKDRFTLYHAHVYLLDETEQALDLAYGAGEIGQRLVSEQHRIMLDSEKSLVVRAARERRAVTVNDVQADPGFLSNPLLPHTRAEMAIPLIAGDKVLGVFDVQANRVNYFSEEDANIFTTLSSQVAVALQNARLYVEQAATVQRLRELDHLKSSFLANMSHELRTPLNSIIGFTEIILEGIDGPLTEFMEGDLKIIQKNGKHLLSLINDVLDMAKIEAGRMSLSYERFTLTELLDDVVDITTSLAHDKQLYLRTEYMDTEETELVADRIRLRQVMINLVGNAVKFTETGGITLRSEKKDGKLWLKVVDTGIGVPPEKLETIFEYFSQVDTSTTRKAGGTGLGLPISRRLVKLHQGELWAESSGIEGEGSVFYLTLPLEHTPEAQSEG